MRRIEGVDFVKGVVITAIVIFHTYEAIYGWAGHDLFGLFRRGLVTAYLVDFSSWESASRGLLKLTCLGYQGVHVFVVLSGFLQMWTSRDREIDASQFYFKRFLRLYPIYWLSVLSVIALNFMIHGGPGATPTQLLLLFFGWAGAGLPFNSALWFMGLIVQLYLVFPILLLALRILGERKFLLGTWIWSVALLYVAPPPWVGLFFGGWLFEFCAGMSIANHYSRIEPDLRGAKAVVLLLLAYLAGLALSNFRETWPLGRPIYGIALTLLIWSIYNTARTTEIFKPARKFFIFMGLLSFPLWLINQPFMQEYYLLLASPNLTFRNDIVGDALNFEVLPISRFLLVEFSYAMIIIVLSFILIKIDAQITSVASSWRLDTRQHLKKPPSVITQTVMPELGNDHYVQISKKHLDELFDENLQLINRCRELLQKNRDLRARISLLEEELRARGANVDL